MICVICNKKAVHGNGNSALCNSCHEFLTVHAPLTIESHIAAFWRLASAQANRLENYLARNSYDYEDDSYL